MNENVIFNSRVVNTLRALTGDERQAITGALASEYFLGIDASGSLKPFVRVIYAIVRNYVEQELRRRNMVPVVSLKAL